MGENKALKFGDIIQCPGCGNQLYMVAMTIAPKTLLKPEHFVPVGGNKAPAQHDKMECQNCFSPWFEDGKVYLRGRGWY